MDGGNAPNPHFLTLAVVLIVLGTFSSGSVAALQLAPRDHLEYRLTDYSTILPSGVESIPIITSTDQGVLVGARMTNGSFVLAYLNPGQANPLVPLVTLPTHFYRIEKIVSLWGTHLISGTSLGIAPVIGVFSEATGFFDLTYLLPQEARSVMHAAPGANSFLLLVETDSALKPYVLHPDGMTIELLPDVGLSGVLRVRAIAWNGSAYFLGGTRVDGDSALLALRPSDEAIINLGDQLPGEVSRVDHLLWSNGTLYIIGARNFYWSTRATLAAYNSFTNTTTDLSGRLRGDYLEIRKALHNGTSLVLIANAGTPTLMVYDTTSDTTRYFNDLIPRSWDYLGMVWLDREILLVGQNGYPCFGILRTADWSWTDMSRSLDGPYRAILDIEVQNDSFTMVGGRTFSPAVARFDWRTGVLTDLSGGFDIGDGTLSSVTWDGSRQLLTGWNSTGALLVVHHLETGQLDDVSDKTPEGTVYFHDSDWRGGFLVAGFGDFGPVLVEYDPETGGVRDLSSEARRLFTQVHRVLAYEGGYVVLGRNDVGAAVARLEVAGSTLEFLGLELAELYGPGSYVSAAAWNGDVFLLGGSSDTGPVLGLLDPSSKTFKDASSKLPHGFESISSATWTGTGFVVGGPSLEGVSLAYFHPGNGSLTDLSSLFPSASWTVTTMAAHQEGLLIATVDEMGKPSIGVLTREGSTSLLDGLPMMFKDPTSLLSLSLALALVGLVAFILGRRYSDGKTTQTQEYGPVAGQMPPQYDWGYDEYPPDLDAEEEIRG